jgi:hypothetical protein
MSPELPTDNCAQSKIVGSHCSTSSLVASSRGAKGGFRSKAEQAKRSGSRHLCQARRAAPGAAGGGPSRRPVSRGRPESVAGFVMRS